MTSTPLPPSGFSGSSLPDGSPAPFGGFGPEPMDVLIELVTWFAAFWAAEMKDVKKPPPGPGAVMEPPGVLSSSGVGESGPDAIAAANLLEGLFVDRARLCDSMPEGEANRLDGEPLEEASSFPEAVSERSVGVGGVTSVVGF